MLNKFNKITDDFYATMQIFPEQIDFIKESGFKSIIINRPDMEKPGQPFAEDMIKLANECNIEAVHIPMVPGQLHVNLIENMADAIAKMPKPILAHCGVGLRSAMLWSFVHVKDMGVDGVIDAVEDAGYSIEKIRPALEQYASS